MSTAALVRTTPAGLHLYPAGTLVVCTVVPATCTINVNDQGREWLQATVVGADVQLHVLPDVYAGAEDQFTPGVRVTVTGETDLPGHGQVWLTVDSIL